MKTMKNNVTDSCGNKRGCWVLIVLPHDSSVSTVVSRVHGATNDFPKILPLANLSLDKKLEKKGQMEKMAA